jgi:hypothetical protein
MAQVQKPRVDMERVAQQIEDAIEGSFDRYEAIQKVKALATGLYVDAWNEGHAQGIITAYKNQAEAIRENPDAERNVR